MHRPRIGIPLSLDDRGRWRSGRDYHYIDRRYADAIDLAGGLPVHLPIQSDPESLASDLDGLLIPGGDDFPSDRPLPESVQLDLVPATQLRFDESLYEASARLGLPILGICYGMQLMARVEGGSLDAHLPTQRPEAGNHRLAPSDRHTIELVTDSLLGGILETGAEQVNSLHHQAVRELGPRHRAVAFGPGGVIEALEAIRDMNAPSNEILGTKWEIGVQWHPEKMDEESSARIFAAFVEASRSRRNP
jgi:putative glutamine amidotransferase